MFDNLKQEWQDLDVKVKYLIGALALVGAALVAYTATKKDADQTATEIRQKTSGINDGAAAPTDPAYHHNVMPTTNRNQGLEDLTIKIDKMSEELARMRAERAGAADLAGNGSANVYGKAGVAGWEGTNPGPAVPPVDLNKDIPPPVNFEGTMGGDFKSPKSSQPGNRNSASSLTAPGASSPVAAVAPVLPRAEMKTWAAQPMEPEKNASQATAGPLIPVNSALEGVMLSGINARPSGAVAGAAGSSRTANDVGAPFVTRLKGDAILPNSWKLSDLGDCFLGGSGIAVLSTERAYVIAENLSCIDSKGEVYEAPIKAYGLDVDGTLGVAGHVVSKQGTILMQAALAGMASGLGQALSPTALPSYNSNAVSGSTTGLQYPSPALVGYTAVGQGVNQAASQLSKFYLDYARELFPVVEVVAGTRVTWILKESVQLKKKILKGAP